MKQLSITLIAAFAIMLSACGNGSLNNSNSNIDGNWSAMLTSNQTGAQNFSFTTSLNQSSMSGSVNISNFQFSTQNSCFANGTTETGAFTVSGNFNGNAMGTFQMGIQANPGGPMANMLTLNGTLNNNTITGTWNLVGGSGCSGSGNFTMTRM